jgi:EAL domain-containing protein (putative c-di-GMP-specific phosphodiesterase class I)
MTKAMVGLGYSERSGGDRITRHGLIAEAVDELRGAIAAGQITVFYQPIVAVGSGQVTGAEALARWLHPDRGIILPDSFIGLAEQSDIIGALGEVVLRQACCDAAGWSAHTGVPPKVAVNVSGQQLQDPAFPTTVRDCLARSGLAPSRLVLEVTESTVAGDNPVAQEALVGLRALGIRIAIDDFGTGYSNLSRLAGMPVDILKLDASFIAEIETSIRTQSLIRGLIAMARELRLSTVVEGVATPAQASVLRMLGAQEGQGWLWGQPVPAPQFALATDAPTSAVNGSGSGP